MQEQNKQLGTFVERLIAWQEADINAANPTGNTALHIAAEKDLPRVVDVLLENNADIGKVNRQGQTALELALVENHDLVAERLLQQMEPKELVANEAVTAALGSFGFQERSYLWISSDQQLLSVS